jgi:hypothetical protein
MKNLLKVSAILIAFLFIVFSCQKRKPVSTDNQNLQRLNKDESGHPADSNDFGDDDMVYFEDLISGDLNNLNNTFYTPSNIQFTVSLDNTNDTTIVLTKKMMEFSDTTALFNAIGIMEYQLDSILDAWETANAFVSLRKSYEGQSYTSAVDYRNKRPFMDPTIECMVNEEKCLKAGNLIFIYLLKQKKQIVYDELTEDADIYDIIINSGDPCLPGDKIDKSKCYTDASSIPFDCDYLYGGYQGQYVILCTKFNYLDLFTASLGMETSLLEYSDYSNSYDPIKTTNLHMRKDQWHVVKWRFNKNKTHVNIWSSNKVFNTNKKIQNLKHIIARKNGFFLMPYCVEAFERVHAWPFIYENDLHHEDYKN